MAFVPQSLLGEFLYHCSFLFGFKRSYTNMMFR
jgi:hypothetical protein